MPNSKELSGSLYDTVTTHGDTLIEHDMVLKQHADEISLLKKSDEDIMRELKGMKMDLTGIENTILKSAQETRDIMNTQNTQQWELIKVLNAGNQEERVRKHEITKTKVEKYSELIIKVAGAGGILIVLAELIFGGK